MPQLGTAHHAAKLTPEKVLAARKMWRTKLAMLEQASLITVESIAKAHGVGKQTMWDALVGRSWAHVPGAISRKKYRAEMHIKEAE